MQQQDKSKYDLLRYTIHYLNGDVSASCKSIKQKNYIQAKLYLAVCFGMSLPLTFQDQNSEKPPFANELIGMLHVLNAENEDINANWTLRRPYNKIIKLINNAAAEKPHDIEDYVWYEALSQIAATAKIFNTHNIVNLWECANSTKNCSKYGINVYLQTIKTYNKIYDELTDDIMPKITSTINYKDKFDGQPLIHTGLLYDNGYVLDLKTYQYVKPDEYEIILETKGE